MDNYLQGISSNKDILNLLSPQSFIASFSKSPLFIIFVHQQLISISHLLSIHQYISSKSMKDERKMGATEFVRKKLPKDNQKTIHQSQVISNSLSNDDTLGPSDEFIQDLNGLGELGELGEMGEMGEMGGMGEHIVDLEGPEDSLKFQEQRKFKEVLIKFQTALREYGDGKLNLFSIDKPAIPLLMQIIQRWYMRKIKTETMLLDLHLTNSQIPQQKIQDFFEYLPSIKLMVNGQSFLSKGKLFTIGEYFYEGTDKSMTISSHSMESLYIGEVSNNDMHGNGKYYNHNKQTGFSYEGKFVNNHFHGQGLHRTLKGMVYNGEFRNDFKEGIGEQIHLKRKKNPKWGENPNFQKSKYRGPFKQGDREGHGVEETKKFTYTGDWKKGVKCGNGQIKYKNGDRYKGQWANGAFHGKGEYFQKDNSTYRGSFVDGKYEGKGCMEYENGDKYEGEYLAGKKHGQGIYTWSDGDYYDGQWIHDSAEGHGTSMIGTDFYDGEFKNGKKNGEGQLTNEDGDILHAVWENDVVVKRLEWNGEPENEQ